MIIIPLKEWKMNQPTASYKLCATFCKVYYRVCTARHVIIKLMYGCHNLLEDLTWVARWMSYVKRYVLTPPEHLQSFPVFSSVRVTRSLVFCVVFCRLLFVIFSLFGHSVVCPPSVYSFLLLLLYLYIFLILI